MQRPLDGNAKALEMHFIQISPAYYLNVNQIQFFHYKYENGELHLMISGQGEKVFYGTIAETIYAQLQRMSFAFRN
ncbi:hypothetical protein EI77_04613 [Prosthecobacter fusiformis]|uniref:Uncharacterized protein n=1 Tax=Prosthecobacter fusiformis TaxID=48464 RepID=A0A4R7RJE9_9BACT|nr:hypothetical protein EI77_04613 [Prosthecobacter fusiformis]